MPENWTHYVGIDLDRLDDAVGRLREESELLGRISEQGREWSLQHYGPVPAAKRFLQAVLGKMR